MSATVIGWATNVNKIILNETSGEVGNNAVTTQQAENGGTYSILNGWRVPPRFSVVMMFDHDPLNEDVYGLTEYERFEQWFESRCKYGTIPFSFPALTKSNPTQTTADGYARYTIPEGKYNWSAEGCYVKVVMTWEQFYFKSYKIRNIAATLSSMNCYQDHIEMMFSTVPDTIPDTGVVELSITNSMGTSMEITNEYMTNDGVVFCYHFDKITLNGTYDVTLTYEGKTLTGKFIVA